VFLLFIIINGILQSQNNIGFLKIPGIRGLSETHPAVWQIHPEYYHAAFYSPGELFPERVQEGKG